MWRVLNCIAYEHDYRFTAIACAVCLISSVTGATILQIAARARTKRNLWIALSGSVVGVGIWTTHYAAMLGYVSELKLSLDVGTSVVSVFSCIVLTTLGAAVALTNYRHRGILAGLIVGLSVAVAHYTDMRAIRVSGFITYDSGLVVASVLVGIAFCMLAGWLLMRFPSAPLALPAVSSLSIGVLSLHFLGMASVTIVPLAVDEPAKGEIGITQLGAMVVIGSLLLVCAALAAAYHNNRIARITAGDRRRLLQAVDALQKSEAHHRASVALNPQIPWLSAPDGKVIEMSPRWSELTGIPTERVLGLGWSQSVHPEDLPHLLEVRAQAVRAGAEGAADCRYRLRLKDGSYRWMRARARPRLDEHGQVMAWYGNVEDIDDQVRAELALRQSEETYRLASRATNDVIWDWHHAAGTIRLAGAISDLFPSAETGFTWWIGRIHPEDRPATMARLTKVLGSRETQWQHEYRFFTVCGEYRNMVSRGYVVRDAAGKPVRSVGSLVDITVRKRIEEELRWAAFHDPLTRLANRALYNKQLQEEIEQAKATGTSVALIVIDLNKFKSVNDFMGHSAGDELLCEFARRLVRHAPQRATVARLGGDEFAIILPGVTPDGPRPETVQAIVGELQAPVDIDGSLIEVTFCAGAALWPRDAVTTSELLSCADLALYAAKAEAPTIRVFDPEMRRAAEHTTQMLERARSALRDDRIVPFYQPKVCLKSGEVIGSEALLRWHDHRLGLQPPASIAAAFDDAELALHLTDRMLDCVVADCRGWADRGLAFGRIAINATSADFSRGNLAERFLGKIEAAGLDARNFELEVTESVFLGHDIERVRSNLEALRQAGVTVALDDFGTGYASLTHLQEFKMDVLKIDRSFVAKIAGGRQSQTAIVDAVIQMARSLGIQTVAEGIETTEQANYLRDIGCDLAQGYLFARPLSAARLEAFLRERTPLAPPLVPAAAGSEGTSARDAVSDL